MGDPGYTAESVGVDGGGVGEEDGPELPGYGPLVLDELNIGVLKGLEDSDESSLSDISGRVGIGESGRRDLLRGSGDPGCGVGYKSQSSE